MAQRLLSDLEADLRQDHCERPYLADSRRLALLHRLKSMIVFVCLHLPEVRIHDLRHTYASHALASGLSLELIGKLLGHTQYQTTMRYAHLADGPLRSAAGQVALSR